MTASVTQDHNQSMLAATLTGTVSTVKGAGESLTAAAANTASSVAQVAGGALSAVGAAVPKGLVVLDNILDFIPFGSTANNLIDLGVKHLVVKDMDPNSSAFKEYIEHVQKKDSKACVVFGIPFVGNVAKLGSVVYSYVSGSGDDQKKKTDDEPFNLPPALGTYDDGSALVAGLLENEHGTIVYRDPLETLHAVQAAGGAATSSFGEVHRL